MKKIKLSEEQDRLVKQMMLEAEALKITTNKTPTGNLPQDIKNLNNALSQHGLTDEVTNDPEVSASVFTKDESGKPTEVQTNPVSQATYNQVAKESVIITKKQLNEVRLKKLKSNSQVIKVKDFLK